MKFKVINESTNFVSEFGYSTDNGGNIRKIDEETLNRIIGHHDASGYAILSACRSRFFKDDENEVPRDVYNEEDAPKDSIFITSMNEYNKYKNSNATLAVADANLVSGQKLSAINNRRTIILKNKIIKSNMSFIPVYGGYKEIGSNVTSYEKSFIVFNFDRKGNKFDNDYLVNNAIQLGKEFDQDSVLIKLPNKSPKYIITDPNNMNFGETDFEFSGDYTLNDITQEYFTALKKIKNDSNSVGKPQRFTFEGVYINPSPRSVHEATRRHHMNELFEFPSSNIR